MDMIQASYSNDIFLTCLTKRTINPDFFNFCNFLQLYEHLIPPYLIPLFMELFISSI